jgi:hypothetical protein
MEFLIPIFGVAAIIWVVAFVLRGSILAGCAAFLLATCCLGHEFFHFNVGVEMTLDRMLMLVLIVVAAIQHRLGLHDPKPFTKQEWLILAFLGLLAIHVVSQPEGFDRGKMSGAPYWHLIIGYTFPFALYFIGRNAKLTERNVLGVQNFLVIFGIYLGLTGIMEMAKQWWAVWPGYIADEKVGLHYGRARGPMVQSVSYGFYVVTCAAAALLAFRHWSYKPRIFLPIFAFCMIAAAGLTLTRSVWLGLGLAIVLLIWFCLRDPLRKYLLFGGVATLVLLAATNLESIIGFQREGSVEDTSSSAECRKHFAYVSWLMFQDKPIFGFGFGNFPEEKLPYLDRRDTDMNMELIRPLIHHNTYLDLLVELGLIGFVMYLSILVNWIRMAMKLNRQNRQPDWVRTQGLLTLITIGVYMIQMMFHEVTFTSIDNSLLYLMCGISSGLAIGREHGLRNDTGRDIGERRRNTDQRHASDFNTTQQPAPIMEVYL